jgi:dTDP-glucose pyrophosphorylase
MQLNDTHQLLVYADDNILLDERKHAIKKTEALLAAGKEIGLHVNDQKSTGVLISL